MNDDKRSAEASSLRKFFDDQIRHLQELAGRVSRRLHEDQRQAEQDRQIVEHFVDASNNKMRAVRGYSNKLRGRVRALYNHVLQIADAIPPPVDLNRDSFAMNPLINALFVNSDDITGLFKTDLDVNDYFRAHYKHQAPILYALLTASRSEKRTLGISMVGEVLVHDVPQQAINFSCHKIHTPCASSEELSAALKKHLFDRVVALAKQEMQSRMAGNPFKPSGDTYEARLKSLANPDVYLNALLAYLENPAKLLSIDKTHLKLSKLGIKLDSDDRQCANEFDIHELAWSDNTREVVLQISHTR